MHARTVVAPLEFDLASSRRVLAEVATVAPGSTVILDMRDTTFIDSLGLGVLVRASQRLTREGGSLVLETSPQVQRVLDLAGLSGSLETLSA